MVLQRDEKVRIWGWASPNEKIKISFNKKSYKTNAGADGKWNVFLAPTKTGGPYTMTIDASNHIAINNILMGDVWLCSGQSNMVHQLSLHAERYAEEIRQANNPDIRQFWVPNTTELQQPHNDLSSGYWKSAVPNDILQFSAVAYFFAKKIYDRYHIPIGIINSSVGGPPIESWMSEESLKEFPAAYNLLQKNKDTAYVFGFNRRAADKNSRLPPQPEDKGMNESVKWFEASYIPQGWRTIAIPGYWEDQGSKDLDGIVWYRKEIDLPSSMAGVSAKLVMGRIVDADYVYVNGELIGNTTYQYPQRRYQIPAGVLKAGKNIIVIRVINYGNKGGFVPDKPYYLAAGRDTVSLTGYWQCKVGSVFTPRQMTSPIDLQYQPAALYNAMIAPLENYTIKGFVWYQGEGNISKASEYEKLLPAMIRDWRDHWQQGDLPFLFAQLPNFGDMQYKPSESDLAVLRQGQLKTLSVSNTQMAVTIDVGEWNDIHPDRKKDVGDRLALGAMNMVYGAKDIVPTGPIYQSVKADGNKIIISFYYTGSGLITNDGGALTEFAIAGADKKFVWAKASIEGDKVIVWNDAIPNPVYVRYAWADSPVHPNLYNKEGLPASPFEAEVSSQKNN